MKEDPSTRQGLGVKFPGPTRRRVFPKVDGEFAICVPALEA